MEKVQTLFDRVKSIIVEQLGVEDGEVTIDTSFTDDLNADSLDLVELVMVFEETFGNAENPIEIPDEDVEKILTVGDTVKYLKDHGVED